MKDEGRERAVEERAENYVGTGQKNSCPKRHDVLF